MISWKAGNERLNEPSIDDMIGLIVSAENNAPMTISGVLAGHSTSEA